MPHWVHSFPAVRLRLSPFSRFFPLLLIVLIDSLLVIRSCDSLSIPLAMTSWKHLLLCESFYILVSLFVGAFSRCLSLPVALLSSLAISPFRGRGFGCARSLASRCLRLCFGLVDSRAENFGRCASRLGWPHLSSLIPLPFSPPFQSFIVRSNSGLFALSRVRRAVQTWWQIE